MTIATIKGLGKIAGFLHEIGTAKVGKNSVLDLLKNGSIKNWKDMSLPQKGAGILAGGYAAFDAAKTGIHGATTGNKKEIAGSIGGTAAGLTAFALTGNPYIALASEQGGKKLSEWGEEAAEKWVTGWNTYNKKHKPNPIKQPIEYHAFQAHDFSQSGANQMRKALSKGTRQIGEYFLSNPFTWSGFWRDYGASQVSDQEGSNRLFKFLRHPIKQIESQFNDTSWIDEDKKRMKRSPLGKALNRFGKWLGKNFEIDWGAFNLNNRANKPIKDFISSVRKSLYPGPKSQTIDINGHKMKAQLAEDSILPNLHPIKWAEKQFKGFHWPKLPKWHIKMPNFHPVKWLESKFKGWHLPKLQIHKPSLKGINSFIDNLKKNVGKGFNFVKKSAGDGIKGILGHIDKLREKGKTNLGKFSSWVDKNWNGLKKKSGSTWNNIKSYVVNNANNARKKGSSNFNALQKSMSDTGKQINKQWHSLWNGIANFFESIWKSIKKTGQNGINDIIGVINGGISGIDNVIHSFGGKTHAISLIPKVKLATGTLGNKSIMGPTLAILNDGSDSPETGNKETIWNHNNGQLSVVHGTNVPVLLDKGMDVFSASQSRDLGFTRFAKGTNPLAGLEDFVSGLGSWIGQKGKQLKKWFDLATKIVSHPLRALDNLMKPSTKGLDGIFVQLGKGMFNHAKDAAKDWWSALWNMASGELNGDGGPARGLLKAVEKYGEGHKYIWGATGPSAFDCSGLVMYALKHAYGIDFPHFSGSQYGLTQHISKANAKMGDLVFWGNHGDEHVGVYAGNNRYFSAESPSQGIHMNTLDSVVGKGRPLFGRVRGLSQGDSKKGDVKAKNGLEKTIKDQVGNGFFHFLKRLGDLFNVTSGMAGMPTGDHTHWMKQAGIPRRDWNAINWIVSSESGWNPRARNPSSGTYGLGQMQSYNLHYYRSHGGVNNPIAQLMGIMDYIHDRYGSVAHAVAFRKAHGWYANGGIVTSPELAVVGEDGIERIINVRKPTADALIDNTIQARAQVAPESPSGKLAKMINLDSIKYSTANGYRPQQQSKSPAVVRTLINNGQSMPKGNVKINVKVGSSTLASVIYPKIKILQGHDIDLANSGGAII